MRILPILTALATGGASLSATADSLEVFGGRSTRILDNSPGHAWGVSRVIEYPSFRVNFGYLNEGHNNATQAFPVAVKRDGIFLLGRLERPAPFGVTTYFELGPYLTGSTITENGTSVVQYRLTAMGGFGASLNLSPHAAVTAAWRHVFPGATRTGAADTFLIGPAWRF